jgi:hypothetical protein
VQELADRKGEQEGRSGKEAKRKELTLKHRAVEAAPPREDGEHDEHDEEDSCADA